MTVCIDFQKYKNVLNERDGIEVSGSIDRIVGLVIEGKGPGTSIGTTCDIFPKYSKVPSLQAEVIGFRDNKILLMPLGDMRGIMPGDKIVVKEGKSTVGVGTGVLGRILDGLGNPIDGKGPILTETHYPLIPEPLNPMQRGRITEPIDVGIKALNGVLTFGKGQRVGLMSGTGLGKSILMGMISRNTSADVSVIALIGERGREVREFVETSLGEEGLKRSVVVAATSDQPPLVRLRGAFLATTIAEFFQDMGKDVILMMDSVTRVALAQREVGLAAGEPPTTRGFTPSVFSLMPKLLERTGKAKDKGSITGIYSVLVEGDDLMEPISDAVRSIVDGHIVLTRHLAAQNHYPAIDLLDSVSRLMIDVVSDEHLVLANRLIEIMATYKESEDLINIGAYVKGSSAKIDFSIKMIDSINKFLKQGIFEKVSYQESIEQMKAILEN
ncbi:MAG TPA: FliI/YscN family ATPase [Nitrospinota bacterium]|jgi:flagellum-specific ATP synthase|nr:FliI/YscN family ATPase [Nitrospinota bacterium]